MNQRQHHPTLLLVFADSTLFYHCYSPDLFFLLYTSDKNACLCDNEEHISKVRFWATQSRESARHYQHKELGFNYRMSNVVAGIGMGQLKVLERRVQKKDTSLSF